MTELAFAKQFLTALEARPARLSSDHVVDPKSYPAQPAFILPRMPQPKRKPTARSSSTTEPTSTAADATSPPTTAAAEGPLATVTLKPTRATLPTYTIPAPVSIATTSIHDLKAAYAAGSGAPDLRTDKIKILHAKKPVNDTKTIKDVLGAAAAVDAASSAPLAVEFSVMVLGGGGGGGTPSAGTPAISTPERVASPPVAVPPAAAAPPPQPSQPEIEMGEAPVAAGPEEAAGILQTDEFWADLKGFLVQRLKDEGEGERLAGVFKEAWQQKGGSA
ncbi:hypothetical protein DBV05_g5527 [Lasiodiplodia theobromae]|uniref:Ubiquitin-like domain-containing protein n=1 Tax=Lasiodiplodia theobromae TaxID=45133 RepID=A0A5N5DDE2_9PEZI|nr:hypothetical protein DBV05_g5527 [Lasiodiplodia theobromae]